MCFRTRSTVPLNSTMIHNTSIVYRGYNARLVRNEPYRGLYPSHYLLKSLYWLPVVESIEYQLIAVTHTMRLHQQPSYLLQHINQYRPTRTLRSLNSSLFTIPTIKTVTAVRAFCIFAPIVWNSLLSAARVASSQHQFLLQFKLKRHLF